MKISKVNSKKNNKTKMMVNKIQRRRVRSKKNQNQNQNLNLRVKNRNKQ